MHRLIIVFAIAAAAAALGGTAMAADVDKPIERSLSVAASGSIQAVPDIATISAGVLTEADTAREALNRNNAVMAKLIDGLKAAKHRAQGHPDQPAQRLAALRAEQGGAADYGQRLHRQQPGAHHRARHQASRRHPRPGHHARRRRARHQLRSVGGREAHGRRPQTGHGNARRRDELYATAAGAQLGPVLRISEGLFDNSSLLSVTKYSGRMAAVPVEAGTKSLTINVQVTYALQ